MIDCRDLIYEEKGISVGCCQDPADRTNWKDVEMSWPDDIIRYDTTNNATIVYETREGCPHQFADVCDDTNLDARNRNMVVAFGNICNFLHKFVYNEVEDGAVFRDEYEVTGNTIYEIKMKVPRTMSVSALRYVHTLIHEYFVYFVLANWAAVVYPDGMEPWSTKLKDCEEKIKTTMQRRTTRVRRPATPF